MIIFCHPTGPLLRFRDGVLEVEDLNPEIKTKWRMTRTERFYAGFRLMLSAMKP